MGLSTAGALPDDPVVVIGMGSSGTRLVVRLLEACGVFMGGELAANAYAEPEMFYLDINAFIDDFRYHLPLRRDWQDVVERERPRLEIACMHRLPLAYRAAGYEDGPWGFKDPRNTFAAIVYLDIFPRSQVLHVVRDGLDVAETKCREDWGNLPPDRDVLYWLRVWAQVVRVAMSYRHLCPARYLQVRYEDVCLHRPAAAETLAKAADCSSDRARAAVASIARPGRIGKLLGLQTQSIPDHIHELRKELGYA